MQTHALNSTVGRRVSDADDGVTAGTLGPSSGMLPSLQLGGLQQMAMTSREFAAAPSSSYNLRFGAGDVVKSGRHMRPIFSTHRKSLPPVPEPHRGNAKGTAPFLRPQVPPPNQQIEHLLQ